MIPQRSMKLPSCLLRENVNFLRREVLIELEYLTQKINYRFIIEANKTLKQL